MYTEMKGTGGGAAWKGGEWAGRVGRGEGRSEIRGRKNIFSVTRFKKQRHLNGEKIAFNKTQFS